VSVPFVGPALAHTYMLHWRTSYWSGAEDYYLHNTKGAYDYNDNVASPAKLRVAAEYVSVLFPRSDDGRANVFGDALSWL
jgi:hypothetical protein